MLLCSCSHHVIFLYLLFHLPHTYPSSDLGAHGCGVRGMKMFRSSSEDVIKRGSIVDDWGPGWGGRATTFFFSIFLVETIYSLGIWSPVLPLLPYSPLKIPLLKFNTNHSIYVAKSGSSSRFLLSHNIVHFYSKP